MTLAHHPGAMIPGPMIPGLCRDCGTITTVPGRTCGTCGSARIVSHPELFELTLAHVDCDAFFASVEKRDRPELADRPVIVGGGTRGVVSTACYIARLHGVHSAMPMFQALRACPDAVVIRPDLARYAAVARQIRAIMHGLTPLVQVLSIDEAAMDLSGTAALHGAAPAVVLTRFARQVEAEIGITVSIGLATNRMLAKIAAGQDKPRGFAILGRDGAATLAREPVGLLPGVGPVMERRLRAAGITLIGQLAALGPDLALRRLGSDGPDLVARAQGRDRRVIDTVRTAKSVSAETTFQTDLADPAALQQHLWRLAERLAQRLREKQLSAGGVVLKLKTARFASCTRNARLLVPTILPELLFDAACKLLAAETDGTAFRLIGIGAHPLLPGSAADRGDLADPEMPRRVAAQRAIDALRARFGNHVIGRGRGLDTRLK